MSQNRPIEEAGNAALVAVREHGLYGRDDSPPEWNAALENAQAGTPIFVKDPDDARDDFYLIPLTPANPAALRGVWVMLDPQTLHLREASLLENWKALAFPDENSGDAELASQQAHTLPDGTVTLFRKEDFTPNTKNLVWKASAASILPYWPLKELIAVHPVTGLPVSIYVTQDGKVYSQLLPDDAEPPAPPAQAEQPPKDNPPQSKASKIPKTLNIILGATTLGLFATTAYLAKSGDSGEDELHDKITELQDQAEEDDKRIQNRDTQLENQERQLKDSKSKIASLLDDASDDVKSLNSTIEDLKKDLQSKTDTITEQKLLTENQLKNIDEKTTLLDKAEKDIEQLTATQQKNMIADKNELKERQDRYNLFIEENKLLQKKYGALVTRTNELNGIVNRQNKEVQQFKLAYDQAVNKYRDLYRKYQLLLKDRNAPPVNKPEIDPLDPIPPTDARSLNTQLILLTKRWATLSAEIRRNGIAADNRRLEAEKRIIEKQMLDIRNQLKNLKP